MTWLTTERRIAWPFPETAEEMRLHDAGLSWHHLRVSRYAAQVVEASRTVRFRPVDPRQLELAI